MLWQQRRVLPESELETAELEISTRLAELEDKAAELRTQLSVVQHLRTKLIPLQPSLSGEDGDDEEDDGSVGPSALILEALEESETGLSRDQIFLAVKDRLNSRSNNPRNLVVNILNRLEKRYKKIERVGEQYYLAGEAPPDYNDYQAPALDDDDDLPF